MITRDTTTLREFIQSLEELAENGKNDNTPVLLRNFDEECYDIGWFGFDTVYPPDEVEECNPQNGTKCLIIDI
jgi:hypothetical protein